MREMPVSDVALKNVKGGSQSNKEETKQRRIKMWWPVVSPEQQSTCPN